MEKGTRPASPRVCPGEPRRAAAVKGGVQRTSGSGTELGESLGLVADTGSVEREELGCWERERAELTLASFCKLAGPAGPKHWGAYFLPRSWGPRDQKPMFPSSVVSRGFPPASRQHCLGALERTAPPQPSACALALGLAGRCRGRRLAGGRAGPGAEECR